VTNKKCGQRRERRKRVIISERADFPKQIRKGDLANRIEQNRRKEKKREEKRREEYRVE
jgi:hypothetical protein